MDVTRKPSLGKLTIVSGCKLFNIAMHNRVRLFFSFFCHIWDPMPISILCHPRLVWLQIVLVFSTNTPTDVPQIFYSPPSPHITQILTFLLMSQLLPRLRLHSSCLFTDLSTSLSVSKFHKKYEREKFLGRWIAGVSCGDFPEEILRRGSLLLLPMNRVVS
jgi:hypothetical protein